MAKLKSAKKAKKPGRYDHVTEAQVIMRRDIMNSHRTDLPVEPTIRDEMERSTVRLGTVLDELVGPQGTDSAITEVACEIINSHENLQLSLKQWQVVQEIVEHALRAGIGIGRDS